jgi:Uma2 family endonuclease
MAHSSRILPNYTYEEYCRWEGRWEIIDGIPYAMTPMPSPQHQRIAGQIHAIFLVALREASCDCQVYQPIDVKIRENTVVNPDLLVVCKAIEKQYLDFPPDLVVEILSPSTRTKDLQTKYDLYAEFGIRYYLILDPEDQSLTIYLLNDQGRYEKQEGAYLDLGGGCCIEPDFSQIW